jgi:hypothetical protein
VTSLFMLSSAHYPGNRLGNRLVLWILHSSMAGFLASDSEFTLLDPYWKITSSVQLHLINSHLLDFTRVPWESLTLLVISLRLINDIH